MYKINWELIEKRRKEMRFTLQEMSETLGYSHASSYYRYARESYALNAEQLPIICKKLKLKMKDVIRLSDVC